MAMISGKHCVGVYHSKRSSRHITLSTWSLKSTELCVWGFHLRIRSSRPGWYASSDGWKTSPSGSWPRLSLVNLGPSSVLDNGKSDWAKKLLKLYNQFELICCDLWVLIHFCNTHMKTHCNQVCHHEISDKEKVPKIYFSDFATIALPEKMCSHTQHFQF